MKVHVLLYEPGKESEGIHSLELKGKTVILMFEDSDDADRYCGLLEAQDFPTPSVEKIDRHEIEFFCVNSGYEARFVEKGFIPRTDEERLLISPPHSNLDVTNWDNELQPVNETSDPLLDDNSELDDIRKRLEDLL